MIRYTGIVRVGPTAGQQGKLMGHVKNSRILSRRRPKQTKGGRRGE